MFIDDPEVTAAEAVIDNGSFGKRVVRFETGRLANKSSLLSRILKSQLIRKIRPFVI